MGVDQSEGTLPPPAGPGRVGRAGRCSFGCQAVGVQTLSGGRDLPAASSVQGQWREVSQCFITSLVVLAEYHFYLNIF